MSELRQVKPFLPIGTGARCMFTGITLVWALGGCAGSMVMVDAGLSPAQADPAADSSSGDSFSPTAQEEAVYRALVVRDPAPTCAQLSALTDDPLATLRTIVAHAQMPPWAPMRAASCMLDDHAQQAETDFVQWVTTEQTRGLALLVLGRLDDLPEPVAMRVAQAALAGVHAEAAREHISRLGDPSLLGLLDQDAPEQ